MEINITRFVNDADADDFLGSIAEHGENAAREAWNNAKQEAIRSPLLTTPEQLDALRHYVKGFGAWSAEEIASWSDDDCNALFIQLISGDMREAGIAADFLDEFDWEAYEERASAGQISSNIYKGDDGQIYYYLGS